MFTHENGAKRGEKRPPLSYMPFEAKKAYAERAELGMKYGERNWQKGGQDFFKDCIEHVEWHWNCWLSGELDDEKEIDNHLKAVFWNVAALLWARAKGKLKMWWEKV